MEIRSPGATSAAAHRQLAIQAARKNQAQGTAQHLRDWGHAQGLLPSDVQGLLQLADAVSGTPLAEAIRQLNTQLYGSGGPWDGSALAQALSTFKPTKRPQTGNKEASALPPLYPDD